MTRNNRHFRPWIIAMTMGGLYIPCVRASPVPPPSVSDDLAVTIRQGADADPADYFTFRKKLIETAGISAAAQRVVDGPSSWRQRWLAESLLEESRDPKAYAAARLQLFQLSFEWWITPKGISHVPAPEPRFLVGQSDPLTAPPDSALGQGVEMLKKFPGLIAEIVLKTTPDNSKEWVIEGGAKYYQALAERYQKYLDEQHNKGNDVSFAPPSTFTANQLRSRLKAEDFQNTVMWSKSLAAVAATLNRQDAAKPLLESLDAASQQELRKSGLKWLQDHAPALRTN